jgi:hypothetical protein
MLEVIRLYIGSLCEQKTKILSSSKILKGFNAVNNPVLPQAMRGTNAQNLKKEGVKL